MNNSVKAKFYKTVFKSDANYYIALFSLIETDMEEFSDLKNKTITVTGFFEDLREGDTYNIYGSSTYHNKYGLQLVAESYEKVKPEGKDALISFLSSELFPKVGVKLATNIVNELGLDAITIIKEDDTALLKIPRMTEAKANTIREIIINNDNNEKIIKYILDHGFNMQKALKIYKRYNDYTIEIIENNTYKLLDDDLGLIFEEVDYVALKLNIELDDINRVKAAFVHTLLTLTFASGDTYLEENDIIMYLEKLLKIYITNELYTAVTTELIGERKIVIDNEKVYLKAYYDSEHYIANKLSILNKPSKASKKIIKSIELYESKTNVTYNEMQLTAIKNALCSKLSIITGGPGTGKTTIIKAIVDIYKSHHNLSLEDSISEIVLVAPTGKASKKMSESTGHPASTIHRFLKWNKDDDSFSVNETNQSYAKLVIIDESSMIDTLLFSQLLKGFKDSVSIVIVGDVNQLPPVSPGNVLEDLITSNAYKVTKLDKLYRQSENSYIPTLAAAIKDDSEIDLFTKRDDFTFRELPSEYVLEDIMQVCKSAIEKGYDAFDIQVLSPIYRGRNGIDSLNRNLQNIFNPKDKDKKEIKSGEKIYRVGDKILELNNIPEENIFNGDIGTIIEIYKSGETKSNKNEIVVDFDGNIVTFTQSDFFNITHGFAISIHKSQGSEFKIVVIPVDYSFGRMLNKKLIYTAVTRAKKSLILVGQSNAFYRSIQFKDQDVRKTGLKDIIILTTFSDKDKITDKIC